MKVQIKSIKNKGFKEGEFDKILAVEGLYVSQNTKKMFLDFKRNNLSSKDRINFILNKHRVNS